MGIQKFVTKLAELCFDGGIYSRCFDYNSRKARHQFKKILQACSPIKMEMLIPAVLGCGGESNPVKPVLMYRQSLTLEGCLHFHLVEGKSFSVLTFSLALRSDRTSNLVKLLFKAEYFFICLLRLCSTSVIL